MVTEEVPDGPNLGDVTNWCGGAVGVDAVHIFEVATRLFQSKGHGPAAPLAIVVRSSDVPCVARDSATQDLAMDSGASGFGVGQTFQNQNGCTFSHHKTITVPIKWT